MQTNVQFVWFSSVQFSRSVVSDSSQPHGLQQASLLCPWSLPGKKMGCHSLLHGILTQGSNPSLRHCRQQILYHLSHQRSPRSLGQFSSVAQSCPTLCDPMDCSTPGFPVQHQLLEFTQTRVHCIGDAIQPSHPLSSPSPSTFNLSQHQGLFQWVSSLNQVAKVLELQLQHLSI